MSNALDRCRDALVETVGHGGDSFIATVVPDDLALLIALADAVDDAGVMHETSCDSFTSEYVEPCNCKGPRIAAAIAALTQEAP